MLDGSTITILKINIYAEVFLIDTMKIVFYKSISTGMCRSRGVGIWDLGPLKKITKLQISLGTGTDPVENHKATQSAFKTWVQSQTQNKLQ